MKSYICRVRQLINIAYRDGALKLVAENTENFETLLYGVVFLIQDEELDVLSF